MRFVCHAMFCSIVLTPLTALPLQAQEKETALAVIRSAGSGPWSAPATWEGLKVPRTGANVQIRTGHSVLYDVKSNELIRVIHIAGTLTFAPDRDTRLDVGLIKIQPSDDASENGFDCDAHVRTPDPSAPRPALEVGTPDFIERRKYLVAKSRLLKFI